MFVTHQDWQDISCDGQMPRHLERYDCFPNVLHSADEGQVFGAQAAAQASIDVRETQWRWTIIGQVAAAETAIKSLDHLRKGKWTKALRVRYLDLARNGRHGYVFKEW